MSKPVSSNHITGTGCGNDLMPLFVESSGSDSVADNLQASSLLDPSRAGIILTDTIREPELNLHIRPGFGYIGDREFYLYKKKIIALASVSLLSKRSDGYHLDITSINGYIEPSPFMPDAGKAPILVYLIDQDHADSLLLSSTSRTITAETASLLDLGCWDLDTTSNFAWTYSYWREDDGNSVSPSDYLYVPVTGEIVITSEIPVSAAAIAVVYEGDNSSIVCYLDMNPLSTPPEDGIVCLSPNSDPSNPVEVSTVELFAEDSGVPGSAIKITAIARDSGGNRVSGARIRFAIKRTDLPVTSGRIYTRIKTNGSVYMPVSMMFIDIIDEPGGAPAIGSYVYGTSTRVGGTVAIPAVGYLSPSPYSTYGSCMGTYTITSVTNGNGIVSVYVYRFSDVSVINSSLSIPFRVIAYPDDLSIPGIPTILPDSTAEMILSSGPGSTLSTAWGCSSPAISAGKRTSVYVPAGSAIASTGTGFYVRLSSIPVPFMSPSSLSIYSMKKYMDNIYGYTGAPGEILLPPPVQITSMAVDGSGITMTLDLIVRGQDVDISHGVFIEGAIAEPMYITDDIGFMR